MGRFLRVFLLLGLFSIVYVRLIGDAPVPKMPPMARAGTAVEAPPIQASHQPSIQPVLNLFRETETVAVESDQFSGNVDPSLASHSEEADPMAGGSVNEWASTELESSAEVVTIGRDESFYVALQRVGLSHETIMGIVSACKPHTNLRKVRRGDDFELERDLDGGFASLRFDLDPEHYLDVTHTVDGMATSIGEHPIERIVKGARGTITTNLFDALIEQDADPALAGVLADILGWDIDFFRDLRKGDEFVVLFEEHLHDGRRVRDPQILAAHFTNQGETHEAYLYENTLELPAYYDEEGNSLEKQFLRAPLKFRRISSNFSKRRLHPVLKRHMPHYGVDYAAPTGTPVHATADGIVIKRERWKGNGNYVGLRHGQTYETYYLHLSRFAKGVGVGDKVRQGDVIGYVGSTGLSTAPHLDYRVKKNGRWVNPRKLKLPPAEPVETERRDEYHGVRSTLLAELQSIPHDVGTVVMDSGFDVSSSLDVPSATETEGTSR